jgi:dephospho-CoA kinase
MNLYGLTGGIGCGKTTLTGLMTEAGWEVIDADEIAARLMEPGAGNFKNIVDAFGPSILNDDGSINRRALADLVFHDSSLRQKLNDATHPGIRQTWRAEADRLQQTHPESKIVVVIPLLFETGAENEFSVRLCVGCSPAIQRARLRERGWSDDHIESRLQSQWSLEKKIQLSDFVFWNNGTREALRAQLDPLP